jgi:hypothetical protein
VLFQFALPLAVGATVQTADPFLSSVYDLLHLKVPADEDYLTLLSAIGGIAGVFIGLYYAALATVGATIYSQVPNNIRDLLVGDRQGIAYMKFLSFLTFLCLVLIGIRLLGHDRSLLAIVLTTLMAGFGVLSFVQLGRRAFYLFDPTTLSNQIYQELIDAISMVSAGGHRWHDPSFQHHAHIRTASALSNIETLADLIVSQPHLNEQSFVAFSKDILRLLRYYEQEKRKIPSDSRWYARKYTHRDWYRTEDSQISIAYHTGTAITPDLGTDFEWFESRLYPILLKCIQTNTKSKHYSSVQELMQYVSAYVEKLGREGRLKQAFEFLDQLGTPIVDTLCEQSSKADRTPAMFLPILALAEQIATLPIAAILGLVKGDSSLERERIISFASRRWWVKPASRYEHDLPAYILPRLEWLAERIHFEHAALTEVVSPPWYQAELILQISAECHSANLDAIQSADSTLFEKWLGVSLKYKDVLLSAAITCREWEYLTKLDANLASLLDSWDSTSRERHLKGLSWPEVDKDAIRNRVHADMEEVVRRMALQSSVLSILERPSEYPDYAGQFLHTVGERILDALLENSQEFVAATFSAYLDGMVQRFQNLRPKNPAADYWTQMEFRTAGAALLDVMDISGYAWLLAEVHGNPRLWTMITDAWEKYLAPPSGDETMGRLLVGIVSIQAATFELPHRGVLRTTWHGRIGQRLVQLPRRDVPTGSWMHERTEIDHSSPVVRAFAGAGDYLGYSGEHLFVQYILRRLPDLGIEDLDWKSTELRRDIEKQSAQDTSRQEPSDV